MPLVPCGDKEGESREEARLKVEGGRRLVASSNKVGTKYGLPISPTAHDKDKERATRSQRPSLFGKHPSPRLRL